MRTLVYDNNGATIDRYSVWIEFEPNLWTLFTMAENPNVFNQFYDTFDRIYTGTYNTEKRVFIKNLNSGILLRLLSKSDFLELPKKFLFINFSAFNESLILIGCSKGKVNATGILSFIYLGLSCFVWTASSCIKPRL